MEALLKEEKRKLLHFTGTDGAKRTNAVCLLGCYQVCTCLLPRVIRACLDLTGSQILVMGRSADEAWAPFKRLSPPTLGYRDACYGPASFRIGVYDILCGVAKGKSCGWIDYTTFDVELTEHYEKVENGDLNEMLPGKFVAFSGPSNQRVEIADGIFTTVRLSPPFVPK